MPKDASIAIHESLIPGITLDQIQALRDAIEIINTAARLNWDRIAEHDQMIRTSARLGMLLRALEQGPEETP